MASEDIHLVESDAPGPGGPAADAPRTPEPAPTPQFAFLFDDQDGPFSRLAPRQQRAVELLLEGYSVVAAARLLQIDRGSIHRWKKQPDFPRGPAAGRARTALVVPQKEVGPGGRGLRRARNHYAGSLQSQRRESGRNNSQGERARRAGFGFVRHHLRGTRGACAERRRPGEPGAASARFGGLRFGRAYVENRRGAAVLEMNDA